jgi:nitroreductase
MTETNNRKADYSINPIFLERWSARSFTGETMPEEDLLTMFEAARWSQSSGNGQPWRFSYTLRTEPNWQQYVDFLVEGNSAWAQNASALVICISKLRNHQADGSEPKPIRTHSLDLGASMQSFTLQARMMDYIAHPMAGIHADKIRQVLGFGAEDYVAEAAIAIGRLAPPEMLSERFRGREIQSQRKPMSDILFKGSFEA